VAQLAQLVNKQRKITFDSIALEKWGKFAQQKFIAQMKKRTTYDTKTCLNWNFFYFGVGSKLLSSHRRKISHG